MIPLIAISLALFIIFLLFGLMTENMILIVPGALFFLLGMGLILMESSQNMEEKYREDTIESLEDQYGIDIETDVDLHRSYDNLLVPVTVNVDDHVYEDTYFITYDHDHDDYELVKDPDKTNAPEPAELAGDDHDHEKETP